MLNIKNKSNLFLAAGSIVEYATGSRDAGLETTFGDI